MTSGHVAVIDIGKTNAKLALVRLADLGEVAVVTRPNRVAPGPPYSHFDVEGHWAFLMDGLARFQAEHGVDAITVTTHGAAAALIGADGALAAPILDYEHRGPEDVASEYDAIRPPFAVTGSPRLAMGLNLGAQLHWQLAKDPALRERVAHVVTYPQYWGYRLTGVLATDVTSLGCHTDLWNPHEGRFSDLPEALGLAGTIAPPMRPGEVLGPVTEEVARATGVAAGTPVHCGIHDSNASLLAHLVGRTPPFSVVSTGTWVVAMEVGGRSVTLDPARDTLVNVNAFGQAVPSARFMGGREHDLLLGAKSGAVEEDDLRAVLAGRVMLLPAVVADSGPFAGRQARWMGDEPADGTGRRRAAVWLYLALMTARCLELIGHQGPVIVEGPFARNPVYLTMLGVAATSAVVPMDGATGTSQGAALLVSAEGAGRPETPAHPAPDAEVGRLCAEYAAAWRAAVAAS